MAGKRRNRIADAGAYLLVRLVVCAVQALPPRLAYALADGFAWLLHRFVRGRREIALANVRLAFPELAAHPVAADRLVRGMFRHFARAAVEFMLIPRKLHSNTWEKYVAFPEDSPLRSVLVGERAALVATAHLGNWELAGIAAGLLGYQLHTIARALDNPRLDRLVSRFRRAHGQVIIGKNNDFDRLAAALAGGAKVGTLADQDAGPRGLFVDFFGRPASAHKALALLALKFDALVVVLGVTRVNRANSAADPARTPPVGLEPFFYAVHVEEVIDPREYAGTPRAQAMGDITRRYAAAVERMVRRHPEQYLWLHRRWKTRPAADAARAA